MRVNIEVTINSGTPINLATAFGLTDNHFANRIFIQMGTGGSGKGYVMDGIGNSRTPNFANASDVTAELAAATVSAPGGNYSDPGAAAEFGLAPMIDLTQIWVDGDHTGDPVRLSAVLNI